AIFSNSESPNAKSFSAFSANNPLNAARHMSAIAGAKTFPGVLLGLGLPPDGAAPRLWSVENGGCGGSFDSLTKTASCGIWHIDGHHPARAS
ncbi:MAG: hypothetical protein KDA87_27680, partial [Planctomycetales bacterium]|nr:hypothetical protein [Planctomycetales bacterium]